ncbi:anaerobic glycerol-3-phosphate dehydrogenase subunit C [bacterium 19MO03SA05]|uniref:Anaerobic glycerol-3-phosphate dehydrogenase subunit C n=1 Tax=bacterium 19MO03SA05 TaxID=2920620 RepID=A0AAU6VI46_UNCXX|nr:MULTISPECIES: anaerobic glycerol-3-phosphate dehydrogenase subunit GlpC [Vibrio]EKO3570601.1 anaerobic glycerol-3-phosphate dehydrogenase subunit C [Vibrio metschnikovii]EKO3921251.1 anaerobic glycerol-3-phosphate dehydrogenase subunit C [Vibrio metschnikovii]EKO3928029.1 anaerobic glycerol-3-phosphate dehydrogenase subunit C [Vibrio metschnikovii]MDQ2107543.1 anaerobic glycerol-3-phosphate dehydrogenase subunit C [Vibrio sp. 2017_1457_15]MDQ2160355.1 anaerobic glycerol-3-phosphate dehydrog
MNHSFIANAPKNTSFDQCIKCTVCTVYCPVAKANPLYPGPKQCGPDGERLRIKSAEYYDDLLKLCTNCKRCETACPSGVRIGDLIAVARGKYGKKPFNPKLMRDYVLSHTDLFGSLATPFAPVVNFATSLPLVKKIMHKTIGVHDHKALPKYSHGTFRGWFKQQKQQQASYNRQVSYFHGCYVNYNHPQLGKDFVRVMNAMNIGVSLLDKEKCCGVPLIANGFHDKARSNALLNVKSLETAVLERQTKVLSTSSTCSFTLQQEYPHVLGVDNSQVVASIEYVTRFLLKEFMSGNAPKMKPVNLKVVYHTPCHLERSGNVIFTIELLKMIPGLELVVLDSECCGLAGTYGFKAENYDVSMKIGSHLFESINTAKADFAVTDCETCKWQIEENTTAESIHPITLLAMALA